MPPVHTDPGSFRDPLSRVYVGDDAVWRGLSKEAVADYEAVAGTQFFREALDRGDIVKTERVEDLAPVPDDWAAGADHAGNKRIAAARIAP